MHTHSQSSLSLALNAGVLWGSEVLGFTPTQLQSIRVDAAKATYRLTQGQNAAITMLANAQAAEAKNIDPAFRHHRQVILAWATGSLGRHSRPRHHAGCAVRRCGQAQSPQAAVVRRHRRCSHLRAHVASAGLERAVCEAPRDPRRHQDRPPGSGAQDGGLLGGPDIPFMVRQLCTLEPVQGPAFLGSHSGHSSFLANWRVGHFSIGACWSSWSREASGPRKGLRGSGARTTAAASSATMDPAPCSTAAASARPCRQRGTCASHRRCAWLQALWVRNTGSSLHMAFFLTLAPFRTSRTCLSCLLAQSAPRRAVGGAHFHGRLFVGQLCAATCWLGSGGGRRRGEPQGGGIWSGTERRFCQGSPLEMAKIMRRPWRGTQPWIRSRCTSTAKAPSLTINGPKHKALGAQGPRAHVWNRLFVSHDEVRAVKVKGHATERDVEAVRTSHLYKRGNDLADPFAKKKGRHTQARFSRCQDSRCVWFPGQASGTMGGRGARFAQVQGVERRHDHGYGRRERDSSASGERRLQHRRRARYATGFPLSSPHVSRKTVNSFCDCSNLLHASLCAHVELITPIGHTKEDSTLPSWFDSRNPFRDSRDREEDLLHKIRQCSRELAPLAQLVRCLAIGTSPAPVHHRHGVLHKPSQGWVSS